MRKWTRVREEEMTNWQGESEWYSRVYISDDGWRIERLYSEGDRALNRPSVAWEIGLTEGRHDGYGAQIVDTMADAKAWVDTELGQAWKAWVEGRMTREEYRAIRENVREEVASW